MSSMTRYYGNVADNGEDDVSMWTPINVPDHYGWMTAGEHYAEHLCQQDPAYYSMFEGGLGLQVYDSKSEAIYTHMYYGEPRMVFYGARGESPKKHGSTRHARGL